MTLAAAGLLVQTADHRLVTLPDRALLDDAEPKHVQVQSLRWCAAVSFAGVGEVRGRGRASAVLYRAITDANADASFEDVATAVADAGTVWLRGVASDARRHTFVMGGFLFGDDERLAEEIPTRLAVISNHQRLGTKAGPDLSLHDVPVLDRFAVSVIDVVEPLVLITGMHPAVRADERARLARLVNRRRTTRQLAAAMAYINEAASERPEAAGAISPHCTSVAMLVGTGQVKGMGRAHAAAPQRDAPIASARPGFDEAEILRRAVEAEGRDWSTGQVVSATFVAGWPSDVVSSGSPYADHEDPLWE